MSEEISEMLTVVTADRDDPTLVMPLIMPNQTTIAQAAAAVRNLAGEGNSYFIFNNFPTSLLSAPNGLAWNPATAAICSANIADNETAISSMLGNSSIQQFPNDFVWAAA